MKRKVIVRILSYILSLLLAFSVCSIAFAGQEVTPVVAVSGMASFPLYYEGKAYFPPETDTILSLVKDCVVPIGKTLLSKNWKDLTDGMVKPVFDMFGPIACNPDGTSVYEVTTPLFPETVDHYPDDFENSERVDDEVGIVKALMQKVGSENVYFFNYDWRLDPLEHAAALNDFINNVLAEKHCSKINMVTDSMGGCVTMSYLYRYGFSAIHNLVLVETAFQGTSVPGTLLSKDLYSDADLLMEYFYTFYQNDSFLGQTLIGLLYSLLDLEIVDVKGAVNRLLDSLVENAKEDIYEKMLIKLFGNMPGIWSLLPNECIGQAKAAMFPGGMDATLEKRVDTYQNEVQLQAKVLLDKAIAGGVNVYNIASYGYMGFPTAKAAFRQSDVIIDTAYESGGAICADHGTTLGKNYQAKGTVCSDLSHHHVSTDGIIDASTCMYPERTWFIKYNRHVGMKVGTESPELMSWLACSEEPLTVHSDSRYPQFTKQEIFSGKLVSLTGDTAAANITDKMSDFSVRTVVFLKGIFGYLKSLKSFQG